VRTSVRIRRFRPRYSETELRDAIAASRCFSEVLRRLGLRPAGGNHATIKRHAAHWGISTDHFDPYATQRAGLAREPTPLAEVLVENSTYSRGTLKRRLFREGLKQRRCELCGQGEEWCGCRMALILDHINGVANDNRLENLQIVCPNCAATLTTHCGRNNANLGPRECARCSALFHPRGAAQRYCSHACGNHSPRSHDPQPERRKVERPPYDQLVAEIQATSYSAVGRKYGVSDNAVRKWIRWYERERLDDVA
jgi:hypothetical protein